MFIFSFASEAFQIDPKSGISKIISYHELEDKNTFFSTQKRISLVVFALQKYVRVLKIIFLIEFVFFIDAFSFFRFVLLLTFSVLFEKLFNFLLCLILISHTNLLSFRQYIFIMYVILFRTRRWLKFINFKVDMISISPEHFFYWKFNAHQIELPLSK